MSTKQKRRANTNAQSPPRLEGLDAGCGSQSSRYDGNCRSKGNHDVYMGSMVTSSRVSTSGHAGSVTSAITPFSAAGVLAPR